MALLGTLQVRMGLDAAQFRKGFRSFQGDLKKGVGKFQRSMRGLTSVGSLGGGLAAGLGLKNLISTAGQFEASMNGVRAVMGDLSGGEFTQLQSKAKDLGKTTQFSAIQSANAIEVLAKNGLKVEDIMGGALDASLLLAASTGSEIPEAADLATDAMLIFGKKASDLGNVANRVNGVMINSKFGFEDYKNALATGGPAAVKAGKSMEEFNSTIGATASFFSSGESAGTAFKVFTDRLVSDTEAAEAAQKKLGISFFDASGKMKSMADIAEGLKKGLSGLSDEDAIKSLTDQFGTRGANFAVALARAGKAGIENQAALQGQADAAKQAETRMQGMAGEAKRAASAMEGLKLQIAEGGLLSAVTKMLKKGTELAGFLGRLPGPVLNVGVALTALVAAAGPLAFGLTSIAGLLPIVTGAAGALGSGLIALTGPIGLVVAAVVGAGVLIYQNWETVKAAFMTSVNAIIGFFRNWALKNAELLQGISAKVMAFKNSVVAVFNALVPIVSAAVQSIATWLNNLLEPIGGLSGAWGILKETVGATLSFIGDTIGTVFEGLTVVFNNVAAVLTGQKTVWEGFRDSVSGILSAIGGLIQRNFGEAIAYLKTLPAKMIQIGGEIINGLVDGIKAKAGEAAGAVKSVGSGLIKAIKVPLMIHSPSRVFKEIGGFLMSGLGLGIKEGESQATGAMSKAAASVVEAGKSGGGGDMGANKLLAVSGGEAAKTKGVFQGVFSNFNDQLTGAIGQGEEGFKRLGDSLIAEVGNRALKSVVGDLMSGLGGLFGGGGGGGFGSILGGIGSLFGIPSFAGGGYTGSQPRSGGLDGQGGYLAMLHPQETVIDETKMSRAASGGRQAAGGRVTVSNSFHIAPGVTQEEVSVMMIEADRQRQREERRRYLNGDPGTAELVY